MKYLIAFGVLVIALVGVFKFWLETRMEMNILCKHVDEVVAYKTGESTFNGVNEHGVDVSCYVRYTHNGRKQQAEWWNVGDCNDREPIIIYKQDSTCH